MKEPLLETMKKAMLLQGIVDTDCTDTKDRCREYEYNKAVDTLRSKAMDLGRLYGTKHDRNHRKANLKSNRNNDRNSSNQDAQQHGRGHNFDDEIWYGMTQENRDFILEARELMKQKKYGKRDSVDQQDVEKKGEPKEEGKNKKQDGNGKESNGNRNMHQMQSIFRAPTRNGQWIGMFQGELQLREWNQQ